VGAITLNGAEPNVTVSTKFSSSKIVNFLGGPVTLGPLDCVQDSGVRGCEILKPLSYCCFSRFKKWVQLPITWEPVNIVVT